MQRCRFFILAALASILGGCAGQSRLSIIPTNSSRRFVQTFGQAYAAQDDAGDYRILLLNDGLASTSASNAALRATSQPPVRQVVHIRLFWRPMIGAKANFPSSANAAIDWYIMGVGSREGIDMVHYRGVGFVSVNPAPGGVSVSIDHTHMQPAACCGSMSEPFEQAQLSGSFFAVNDAELVKRLWTQTVKSAQLARQRSSFPADASAAAR